ncbi:MAG: hypothetical protein ACTS44_01900 [Candidatus Hodgkinia cicadicola]
MNFVRKFVLAFRLSHSRNQNERSPPFHYLTWRRLNEMKVN